MAADTPGIPLRYRDHQHPPVHGWEPSTVGEEALMTLRAVRKLVQGWVDQQGHNKCHYYPEVFNAIAELLGVTPAYIETCVPPTRAEFARGCAAYQDDLYGPLPTVVPSLVKGLRFRTEAECDAFAAAFEFVTDPRLVYLGKCHEPQNPDHLRWQAVVEDRRPKGGREDALLRREQIAASPMFREP